jgi:hypothetical protein
MFQRMLSSEASTTFYEGVVLTYDHGFASKAETLQRLAFLWQNTASEAVRERLESSLPRELLESNARTEEDPDVSAESAVAGVSSGGASATSPGGLWSQAPPLVVQFFVAGIPGMCVWEFHQYDRDYFPSIPHGDHTSLKRKLDAYRGWIYERADQVDCEPRKLIVALWNDAKFRQLARKAILFYMAEYPNFQWRVPRPLRLPRRRRS